MTKKQKKKMLHLARMIDVCPHRNGCESPVCQLANLVIRLLGPEGEQIPENTFSDAFDEAMEEKGVK